MRRSLSVISTDVTPLNRPKWNTILDEGKGKGDEEREAQRGADHRRAEAGGGGPQGRGFGTGMRSFQAHDLRLEVEVLQIAKPITRAWLISLSWRREFYTVDPNVSLTMLPTVIGLAHLVV